MQEELDLKTLFQIIRKRMSLIVVITISFCLVTSIISLFYITPVYSATSQFLVNQEGNDNTGYGYNEIQTSLDLINTYNVIIKSPIILEKVIDDLHLNMSVDQLNQKITVENEQDSQVVNVTVQDSDYEMAVNIANNTVEIFQDNIQDIMNVNNVTIITEAQVNNDATPVSPRPLLNIAIAFVVGVMGSIGLVFLLEYLNNKVETEEDVEELLEAPVLGVVGEIEIHK